MDGIFCFNTMVLANNGIEHAGQPEHAPLVAVESFGTRSHAFPGFGAGHVLYNFNKNVTDVFDGR